MLSRDLELTLSKAFKQARRQQHEYLTVEHLLISLLDNYSVMEVLKFCDVDIPKLIQDLQQFIDDTTPLAGDIYDDYETQPTLGFQRVLQRAVFHAQSAGRSEVTGANVLVAIFGEQDSHAVFLLKQQGISRLDVVNYVAHSLAKGDVSADDHIPSEEELAQSNLLYGDHEPDAPTKNKSPLDLYAIDLNKKARQGKIDPLIGRELEVERVVQALCRRRKNNPLLVGEAGVGKTAIAEGLAKKIVEKEVPDAIAGSVVYSLDLGALLAGTKYRGDFEKRFKLVLKQLQNEECAVLFIDEIHTIIGAGAASGGVMDASNLIKPLLAAGELRCMGSTTYHEYRTIFEKDNALTRRFQKIDVEEPTVDQSINILMGLKPYFEKHHAIKYTDAAISAAVELSSKHINDRFLPDKAIDILDEVGAYQRLQSTGKKVVGSEDVEQIIAKIARIPAKRVTLSDKEALRNLERDLKILVYGQGGAITKLVSTIKLARSGLRDPNKPWGSFLFAGPTGVGKTEVTKQLASLLGIELIRFDMSEYMEQHAVSRLIGAPPGYVGYEQGGLLTDAINKHPYCVLLLDELEKAHPDVFNILLQVMDNGTLTDNNGRKADFHHVIIVMTSNAGTFECDRNSIGFSEMDHTTDGKEAINRVFSPEFRNRLDDIIQFAGLDMEIIHNVVDKFIAQLQGQLDEKSVSLEVDEQVRQWLATHGYDSKMGARPMGRLIENTIAKPLSEEILFGDLARGGSARVTLKGDKFSFKFMKYKIKVKSLDKV